MDNRDAPQNTSPYSDEELAHFKDLLEKEHQGTKEEIKTLKERIEDLTANREDEQSGVAHHQGDVGSEEDEREKFLIMIEKNKKKIEEINAALDRVSLGTYGVCAETGQKIQKERLEAIPYARLSIGAQQKQEE